MADSHYTKANSAVDRARTYAERGGFPDTANAFATIALAEALLNISEKLTVREGTEPYCPLWQQRPLQRIEANMRLVFDTEFMEDGKTIELISIGIVREDGAEYYAENRDANYEHANPWVRKNVLRYLDCAQFEGSSNHAASCKPPEQIASEIREFAGASPEWWAYYADYDWVVLCQLYGRMIDLPMSWPMYCRDLKQEIDLHYPTIVDVKTLVPPPVIEHHALADARWTNEVLNLTRFNPLVGAVETDVVRQENTGHGAPPRRSDQLRKKDPT